MTISQSLTISRDSGDLVITNDPAASNFHIPEGGLAFPDFAFRYNFAPDSPDSPGKQLLGAVLDAGTLPVKVYVHAGTTAALNTARRALEAALSQWTYTVAIEVDGESETYDAFPAWPTWGAVDSGLVKQHMAIATVTIQVNPL